MHIYWFCERCSGCRFHPTSASWSRFCPCSNFVNGHVSTMWFMVCRWPQSQEGDWARPHLYKLARHGLWPVLKRFIRDHVYDDGYRNKAWHRPHNYSHIADFQRSTYETSTRTKKIKQQNFSGNVYICPCHTTIKTTESVVGAAGIQYLGTAVFHAQRVGSVDETVYYSATLAGLRDS